MLPHLFVDSDPPPILLAELGDLGGAHGGALLAARRAAPPKHNLNGDCPHLGVV